MNERLLTVREVAEQLRSSPETVRRWLRQGKLRGFRPGGTKLGYRVPETELQRFLRLVGGNDHLPRVSSATPESRDE